MAALLGAVMNQAIFADIEESATCRAMPLIRQCSYDVALETIMMRKGEQPAAQAHDALVDAGLDAVQGFELPGTIMQNADCAAETEFARARRNLVRIFGTPDVAAENGVDGHIEVGVFRKPLQLAIEYLKAFLRDLIRLYVVDADLQIIESGFVQPFNAIGREQITVCDDGGNCVAFAGSSDQGVEIRVQSGLAAAESYDAGAQFAEFVDAPKHYIGGYGR